MKKIVKMPNKFRSPFNDEFLNYLEPRMKQEIECKCRWRGLRGELQHETDIEIVHPKNRNNPNCNFMNQEGCHRTNFEKCPKCKRCLFADGRKIG